MLISRRSDEDAIIRDARAEIVRLRGEVEELKTRRAEDVSILDDIRDAIGGGPYDTIAKRIRKAIAPAEAKDPAPTMPNGVEGLVAEWEALIAHPDTSVIMRNTLEHVVRQVRDAAGVCICPSGDGSLRWPCPQHPPESTPAAVPAGEAVAPFIWFATDDDGRYGIGADRETAIGDLGGLPEALSRVFPLYTTPPAPVQAAPQEGECASCETEGVFATDGSGPFDCYACGKKVANPDAVAYSVVQIGNRGAAYDPPNTHRAFTYEHQPGNIDASRLGRATNAADVASAGDSIDRGLSLLKELQAIGFGVFQIGPPAPVQAAEQEGEYALESASVYPLGGSTVRVVYWCTAGEQLGYCRHTSFIDASNPADAERLVLILQAALQHRGDSRGGES